MCKHVKTKLLEEWLAGDMEWGQLSSKWTDAVSLTMYVSLGLLQRVFLETSAKWWEMVVYLFPCVSRQKTSLRRFIITAQIIYKINCGLPPLVKPWRVFPHAANDVEIWQVSHLKYSSKARYSPPDAVCHKQSFEKRLENGIGTKMTHLHCPPSNP